MSEHGTVTTSLANALERIEELEWQLASDCGVHKKFRQKAKEDIEKMEEVCGVWVNRYAGLQAESERLEAELILAKEYASALHTRALEAEAENIMLREAASEALSNGDLMGRELTDYKRGFVCDYRVAWNEASDRIRALLPEKKL